MSPHFHNIAYAAVAATLMAGLPLASSAQQPVEQMIKERIDSAQNKVNKRVEEARARAEKASADCRDGSGTQRNTQIRRGDTSGLSQTQTGHCNSQSAVIGQPAK